MEPQRPDPDQLLAAIKRQELTQARGRLKLFFGMAAGVGKTYAMLEAAHQRKLEGVDVVVGVVETHGRAETEVLLAGLEAIPRRRLEHRGAWLDEMDLDAILARRPQLVLVDELAHTNAPGSRHIKRYQDVLELLENGIDVYSTINVQHFESRADAVRQITGIAINETVPDTLIEHAAEIELVDLSPEELRKRLAEGKVYTADRVDLAANNFFRVGNLTALREMALRLTAERVDHQLQDYMQIKHIAGPWKSGERLMVAVSPASFSERLIRWTRRMAYNLEAPWIAVYVESSRTLNDSEKEGLARNLALVRKLGGEVVITGGENVADALVQLAQQRNITQIVIGKPLRPRWDELLNGGSLVDRLLRKSGNIDVYVVTGDEAAHPGASYKYPAYLQTHNNWRAYSAVTLLIALTTAINWLALPWIGYQAVGLIELFAVLLVAVYLGRGPALLAATLSALSWNYLFIEPRFTLEISEPQDLILFLLYFAIAAVAGRLTARLRDEEKRTRASADRTMALYTLAHETSRALNMDGILQTAVQQIGSVFNATVTVILAIDNRLQSQPHPASSYPIDEKEISVATWAFDNSKPAGRFTETLPLAAAQYLPLLTPNRTVGVIGIHFEQNTRPTADQEILLETFVSQVALAIEREILDEAARQSAMLQESERLYTTLLNSISHEMRTPIATVSGAASSLTNEHTLANPDTRIPLIQDIQDAADRLNRLVENLLDMSRLESGRLNLKLEWCDLADVIGVAVKHLEKRLAGRVVNVNLAAGLPLVQMDFGLMEQVLVNLLDNAANYTPPGTQIDIRAEISRGWAGISILDHGKGIDPADLERIFEKFFRVAGTSSGGTGLGLSICKGLVEAHGGKLTAENVPGAGVCFTILLPAQATPPPVHEATL